MQLDLTFAALSDPTRRAMLAQLARSEATVTELASPHRLSQPTISKHLKVLERAGLVETHRSAQARPRRLRPEALMLIDDWLAPFRQQWEARLDRLEAFVTDPKEPTDVQD
ncbi:Transcriptional regulator, ArsR family [Rubellimicrobium mesophilum DSM 19309]|uniref:Transcriptional regulator, ArsR family n=1 Tax=Rubellimicrobium mesophilum DSM 19309 TaxID=442562 RepID=A0A017HQL1_9RHOB|nr:metalloregulator ArsR/SmtB family transcription factor [Rubellimicrobium mesophilum]EYD76585.1 Transcriptional regulator, ArsR family [Rubellimicrobium mesophilum DSM 19309]